MDQHLINSVTPKIQFRRGRGKLCAPLLMASWNHNNQKTSGRYSVIWGQRCIDNARRHSFIILPKMWSVPIAQHTGGWMDFKQSVALSTVSGPQRAPLLCFRFPGMHEAHFRALLCLLSAPRDANCASPNGPTIYGYHRKFPPGM